MFPTSYMPRVVLGVDPTLEFQHVYNFFIISQHPNSSGETVFYGFELNQSSNSIGLTPSWGQLVPLATITESTFASGQQFRGEVLLWDKADTFIAIGTKIASFPYTTAVYRSTNHGATWTDITSNLVAAGLNTSLGIGNVRAYVHPGVFLLTVNTGVGQPMTLLRSTNGDTWEDITASSNVGTFYPDLLDLTGQHAEDTAFYAGIAQNNIIVTNDGGTTWSLVPMPAIFNGRVSTIGGLLTHFDGRWQFKDTTTGSKFIYESANFSSDPNDWQIKSTGITSNIGLSVKHHSFGFAKVPNETNGFYELGSFNNQIWRVMESNYDVDGSWTNYNAFGVQKPEGGYQFRGTNAIKAGFWNLPSFSNQKFNFRIRHGATALFEAGPPGDYETLTISSTFPSGTGQSYLDRKGRCAGNFLGKYY